ncbi:MAG: class I SAM-dependent methyltransferase [Acidimicrobiales bacterium]|jgi:SAM-dependent methyltransferase
MDPAAFDYIRVNAAAWDERHDDQLRTARAQWAAPEPAWGLFKVPERTAHLLPDDLSDKVCLELGCGTAYVSAWLAQRGAQPVGVDPSPGQLAIARQLQNEHSLRFPLILASGEHVPLGDGTVDAVVSEYGAAIWADPYLWVPEAARLLRPGGELMFLGNSSLLMLCVPEQDGVAATDRLLRPYFGMHRFEWPDDPMVDFHLGHGDWIRLLRNNHFEIEDLMELRPPDGAACPFPFVDAEWARKWPSEEVWRARKVGARKRRLLTTAPATAASLTPEQYGIPAPADHPIERAEEP